MNGTNGSREEKGKQPPEVLLLVREQSLCAEQQSRQIYLAAAAHRPPNTGKTNKQPTPLAARWKEERKKNKGKLFGLDWIGLERTSKLRFEAPAETQGRWEAISADGVR